MTQSGKKMTPKDYEKLGKAIEEVYLIGYANPKRFLWFGFLRGIVYGLGIFIGGTIVVALVIWVLSQFNQVPVIGPFVEKIVEIVKMSPTSQF
jgi:threonine/homoserine/homoserine lactone efflux protein